jgi:hypothetical protein
LKIAFGVNRDTRVISGASALSTHNNISRAADLVTCAPAMWQGHRAAILETGAAGPSRLARRKLFCAVFMLVMALSTGGGGSTGTPIPAATAGAACSGQPQ